MSYIICVVEIVLMDNYCIDVQLCVGVKESGGYEQMRPWYTGKELNA